MRLPAGSITCNGKFRVKWNCFEVTNCLLSVQTFDLLHISALLLDYFVNLQLLKRNLEMIESSITQRLALPPNQDYLSSYWRRHCHPHWSRQIQSCRWRNHAGLGGMCVSSARYWKLRTVRRSLVPISYPGSRPEILENVRTVHSLRNDLNYE